MAAPSRSSHAMLRDIVSDGGIGPVCWAGREILQRIFVSVRDRNWQEIAPTQWQTHFDEARDRVTIEARHTSDLVDFRWKGILQLDSDQHGLSFEFSGEALRDMQICRLGLIVLHPVAAMVGATLNLRGPSAPQQLQIASSIHPQAIVGGMPQAITEPFAELEVSRPDLGVLRLAFAGDLFELEDQRNWGDASFKSYCTPLRLGFPRQLDKGTRIAHRMQATFSPAEGVASARNIPSGTAAIFPLLGRIGFDERRDRWRHVQVELSTLREVLARGNLPDGQALELCVDATDRDAQELIEELHRRGAQLARVLLRGSGTQLPSAERVAAAKRWLAVFPSPSILSATAGYYVEHNRNVPLEGAVHGIAFPLTATVHSEDAATVRANVPTISDMVRTAREVHAPRSIAIAPLALHFPARLHHGFPQGMAAPWFAATLMHAALAGVTSVTLADDVLDAIGDNPLLDALLGYRGFGIKAAGLPLEKDVHALELADLAGRRSLLVANLRETPATLTTPGAHGSTLQIPPLTVNSFEIG
jgi:hypothetical protein